MGEYIVPPGGKALTSLGMCFCFHICYKFLKEWVPYEKFNTFKMKLVES